MVYISQTPLGTGKTQKSRPNKQFSGYARYHTVITFWRISHLSCEEDLKPSFFEDRVCHRRFWIVTLPIVEHNSSVAARNQVLTCRIMAVVGHGNQHFEGSHFLDARPTTTIVLDQSLKMRQLQPLFLPRCPLRISPIYLSSLAHMCIQRHPRTLDKQIRHLRTVAH